MYKFQINSNTRIFTLFYDLTYAKIQVCQKIFHTFLPLTSFPDLPLPDGGNVNYQNLAYFELVLAVFAARKN